jgi:hypothetical protein
MGKHSNPSDPAPVLGTVNDDTWTRLITAAVDSKDGDKWVRNALANAENARNN